MQMPFDLVRGEFADPNANLVLPVVILVIVSIAGLVCALTERKKARGHWADNRNLR